MAFDIIHQHGNITQTVIKGIDVIAGRRAS